MCAHFTLELKPNIPTKLYNNISITLKVSPLEITLGKISPALILKDQEIILSRMYFGFPSFNDKYLYNARSETVLSKETFKDSFLNRRAVFPCTSFTELDSNKREHIFTSPTNELLYLAGFYQNQNFVLLTTKPNEVMKKRHPRMPLLLNSNNIENYLNTETSLLTIHTYKEVAIKEVDDFGDQLSLF